MSARSRMSTQELIDRGAPMAVVSRSMLIDRLGSYEAAELHLAEGRLAAAERRLQDCVAIAKGYRSSPGWDHLSSIDRMGRLEGAVRGVADALVFWKKLRAVRDEWRAKVDARNARQARRGSLPAAAE